MHKARGRAPALPIVDDLNRCIETAKPWELLNGSNLQQLNEQLRSWLVELHRLAYWLKPLLPSTSEKIIKSLSQSPVKACEPLFPRL